MPIILEIVFRWFPFFWFLSSSFRTRVTTVRSLGDDGATNHHCHGHQIQTGVTWVLDERNQKKENHLNAISKMGTHSSAQLYTFISRKLYFDLKFCQNSPIGGKNVHVYKPCPHLHFIGSCGWGFNRIVCPGSQLCWWASNSIFSAFSQPLNVDCGTSIICVSINSVSIFFFKMKLYTWMSHHFDL